MPAEELPLFREGSWGRMRTAFLKELTFKLGPER